MNDYMRDVQYYETDRMGIVHHSNYLRWFEEARTYYMAQMGYNYCDIEASGVMIPVIAVSAQYRSGAKYGDRVRIEVGITRLTPVKLSFCYTVYDSVTGEQRVSGASDHCFVDADFRPCSLKKKMPAFYSELEQRVNKA